MSKEILISTEAQERRVAIVNNGRLEEFYIERPQDRTIVGNIYKGRIDAVLPSIGAAFVDIGLPKKGFLYLSEIENAFEALAERFSGEKKEVKKGEEVLVQVVKESFGNKGPRLTCEIGLAGRYLVLMPKHKGQIGVSRRIEDEEERRKLRKILSEIKIADDVGFIVRTAAAGTTKQELSRDSNFLIKLWKRLERSLGEKKAPSLIYEEYDLALRVVRDSFTDDVTKLIVDSKQEFYRIRHFMRTFLSHLQRKVELYRGNELFADKDIERQISRIFESRVYLKSGGYLVIEPTEGLVVIDVNSGRFRKKLKQDEMAFKVNCEAAVEIAHQLILRDLGGIVVIDFIDMEKEGHRREVLNLLKKALSKDRAKYDILGISKFGLVEMTRERIHNTVQNISYQSCPYCQGSGKVKSAVTMVIYALRELNRYLAGKHPKEINAALNPTIVAELLKHKQDLAHLEHRFKTHINLISNPALHLEELKIA